MVGVSNSEEKSTSPIVAIKMSDAAIASRPLEDLVTINVIKFSGEPLLHNVHLEASTKVSHLRALANTQLHKDLGHDASEVSALVSIDGVRLCDTTTLKDCGTIQCNPVTAIVTAIDELKDIEIMFHGLMKTRELVPISSFPSLKAHCDLQGNGGSVYYETSGMYGGFNTTLSQDEGAEPGSRWRLHCKFWSDLCERYADAYEITRKDGIVSVVSDAVYAYNQA